ncbi:MAG: response regulator [SAR324 cluster bacterium]|nr:response regulator [SAR324 cluster bacterium]
MDSGIPSRIIGDPTRLRQILFNLLGNAVKFTATGEVKLLIELIDEKISSESEWCQLHFRVMDTGIGISPDKQSKIFQNFYQADSAITRQYGGSGLGLAICKRLVTLMGGTIDFKSTPGTGSEFFFSLKFKVDKEASPSSTQKSSVHVNHLTHPEAIHTAHPFHTLIVDDSLDNRIIIERFLEIMGGTVDLAENGQEGVTLFQKNHYDLVLIDMQMPVLDGYSATRQIRQWEQSQKKTPTTILALTAHAFKEELQKCLDAGCDSYLIKPLTYETAKSIILSALGRHTPPKTGTSTSAIAEDVTVYQVAIPRMLAPIMPKILESKRNQCQELRNALEQKDFEAIRKLGHKIRGSHNLDKVNAQGRSLENCPSDDVEIFTGMIDELEDFLTHVAFTVIKD